MLCPGHLILCDRLYHEDNWATSWFLVLSTRKITIVHLSAELPFEIKVVLPSLNIISVFPLLERVLGMQLKVYTGNLQTLESRNYSSCIAVGTSISPAWWVCEKNPSQLSARMAERNVTISEAANGRPTGNRIARAVVEKWQWAASVLPSWTEGFIKSFLMQNYLKST